MCVLHSSCSKICSKEDEKQFILSVNTGVNKEKNDMLNVSLL